MKSDSELDTKYSKNILKMKLGRCVIQRSESHEGGLGRGILSAGR
jgi:hypothetical protein